ncbi:unnamed protein product [Mytilus coruscus]|uniref:Uncharacterized protein n=1 Tax=Mytilus coruscus TaxID=42192 RepID=A0A6J8B8J9_MYTCO|nr:unnamed protein product [Mytilus coruscus]
MITGNRVEIKDSSILTMKYMYDDDEFDIFDQDLSLNLLFENIEEVQKSAPCEVSDSAKPSHEIGDNIIIDWEAAATITDPLVISKVETEAVSDNGAGVTMGEELYFVKLNTMPVNAGIVIAGEGENGEGKLDILPEHEDKGEIRIPESLVQSSGIVQISNTVSDGIQTNKANIQMMPEILEDRYIHEIHLRSSKNHENEVESRQLLLLDKDEIIASKTEVGHKLKRVLENTEHRTKDKLKDWRKHKKNQKRTQGQDEKTRKTQEKKIMMDLRKKMKRPEKDTRRKDIMKDWRKRKKSIHLSAFGLGIL